MLKFDADEAADALLTAKPVLLEKLRVACDVDPDGARRGIREVLRFLALTGLSTEGLTPSPRIDNAWHEVILCTREYNALCQRYFGRFVHHDPGGSGELNHRRFRETLRLYNLHFGPPDPVWWGKAAELAPRADCGACEAPPA
ncbi:MAG: glycine-rich domain-containing protein [Nannocystales bacterium]